MSRLIEDYIRELFDEKKISEENREKLWKYYYDKLSKGVDVGWKQNFEIDDKDLVTSLKQSIAEFSAFKETAFRKDLEELLVKDGKLMPWSEFKKEALKVSGDYNARWLETEYHQTVANANAAAQWKDFQRNAELYPNLKLVSVRDARVRPEHKALDGTIRPLNDPFWDNHLPPLDWGCRCHVEQTDEEPTEVKGGVQMKIEFENNPGKTGKIFGGTAYESRITVSEGKEAKKNAEKWSKRINMSNDDSPRKVDEEKERLRNIREEIKNFGKENLLNLKIQHNDLPYDITFNNKFIKEFASQPYKYFDKKINILQNIEEIIKKSKYLGKSDFKASDIYPFSHILEIELYKEKSWIVIKESVDRQMIFYSISDSEKISKNLIKK